jgi:hypothetical protein
MVKKTTIFTMLPLIIGAFTIFIPDFSMFYMWIVLGLYIPLFLYASFLDITGKSDKSAKLRGYVGYFSFVLTSILFALPAIRVYKDYLGVLLLIIGLWFLASLLTFRFNNLMSKIVLGESDELRKYTFILHGTMFFVLVAGGGGYYKAAEYFSYVFGEAAMFSYFSILLLIGSYWMTIFAHSTVGIFTKFK